MNNSGFIKKAMKYCWILVVFRLIWLAINDFAPDIAGVITILLSNLDKVITPKLKETEALYVIVSFFQKLIMVLWAKALFFIPVLIVGYIVLRNYPQIKQFFRGFIDFFNRLNKHTISEEHWVLRVISQDGHKEMIDDIKEKNNVTIEGNCYVSMEGDKILIYNLEDDSEHFLEMQPNKWYRTREGWQVKVIPVTV